MRRHSLWLARAASAAGLVALLSLAGSARAEEPSNPLPGSASETRHVALFDALRDGLIEVEARGQGDDQVGLVIRSKSPNRLQVILPPGLVASAATGQLGGGFQSMGLSAPTNQPGAFGRFRENAGFRSLSVEAESLGADIVVPAGQVVELSLPSVCLNFGLPTPTSKDRFELVAVEDYTSDERARKALRSLTELGTSRNVAQAVVWHVFNGVDFPRMATQAGRKLNPHELALAARFVEALDMSGGAELVDPAYLQEGRVFVKLRGDAVSRLDLARISREMGSHTMFGLPVRVVEDMPASESGLAGLLLDVEVSAKDSRRPVGRVAVYTRAVDRDSWTMLGTVGIQPETPSSGLDGATLADAIDRAIARTFIKTKVVRRSPGVTTLAIENRLPLTIAHVAIRAGQSDSVSGVVDVTGIGLGPARSTTATIPAANGMIERVQFNGL